MTEFDFEQEVVEGVEMETEVPEVKERVTYTLKDGSEGSRAEYLREIFLEDNLSRKEISEKYDVPYRIVYSATVNLENDAEAPTRGRAAQNAVVQVTEDNQLVMIEDDVVYVQGEVFEGGTPVTEDKLRNDWITEMVEDGVSRGDVAKMLGLSYGVIYGVTKDLAGARAKHTVTLDDGTEIPRTDYIRQQYADGKERSEIAKELDVAYTVVWQATKVIKTDSDKFVEAIEALEQFAGKVNDPEAFADALVSLQAMDLIDEEEEV